MYVYASGRQNLLIKKLLLEGNNYYYLPGYLWGSYTPIKQPSLTRAWLVKIHLKLQQFDLDLKMENMQPLCYHRMWKRWKKADELSFLSNETIKGLLLLCENVIVEMFQKMEEIQFVRHAVRIVWIRLLCEWIWIYELTYPSAHCYWQKQEGIVSA